MICERSGVNKQRWKYCLNQFVLTLFFLASLGIFMGGGQLEEAKCSNNTYKVVNIDIFQLGKCEEFQESE